jgi:purine catabolism regulator
MAVTVRSLLELEEANLSCVAGERALDTPVRWVHVSEILDPTPWLKGGEFLITTGLRLVADEAMRGYVARLSDHGIAGIGFGIGSEFVGMHADVPVAFIEAAEARGLPVLEVPIETPYVLISEFVSAQHAAEQYRTIQRAFEAQRQLTHAALTSSGRSEVLRLLSSLVSGWAAVTTATGRVVEVAPRRAARRIDQFLPDLTRVRTTASAASVGDETGATTAIHPLGAHRRVRRMLLVGKDKPFDAFDRVVIGGAVTLLSIETEQTMSLSSRWAAVADVLGTFILRPDALPGQRERAAAGLGLDTRRPLRIARLYRPGKRAESVAERVHDVFSEAEITNVTTTDAETPGLYTIIVQESGVSERELRSFPARFGNADVMIGVSTAVRLPDLPLGVKQAQLALSHALTTQRSPAISFTELTMYNVIVGLVPPEQLSEVSDVVLAPLDELDRSLGPRYTQSLAAFLRHNGHWERAAKELGVHRQTLVKRIGAIESRLGLSLKSPDTRMGLWFALIARGAIVDNDRDGHSTSQ